MILLANEFLDALPIRQFVRRGSGGRSGMWPMAPGSSAALAEGAEGVPTANSRHPALSPAAPLPRAAEGGGRRGRNPRDARPGARRHLGERLRADPGVALFLDYGPLASGPGDSLQALRDGQPGRPAGRAGQRRPDRPCRLRRLRPRLRPAGHGPLPQGKFLTRLGLFARINRLAQTLPPREAMRMTEAAAGWPSPTAWAACSRRWRSPRPACPPPPGSRHDPASDAPGSRRRTASSPARAASPPGRSPASIAACPAPTTRPRWPRTAAAWPPRSAWARWSASPRCTARTW